MAAACIVKSCESVYPESAILLELNHIGKCRAWLGLFLWNWGSVTTIRTLIFASHCRRSYFALNLLLTNDLMWIFFYFWGTKNTSSTSGHKEKYTVDLHSLSLTVVLLDYTETLLDLVSTGVWHICGTLVTACTINIITGVSNITREGLLLYWISARLWVPRLEAEGRKITTAVRTTIQTRVWYCFYTTILEAKN